MALKKRIYSLRLAVSISMFPLLGGCVAAALPIALAASTGEGIHAANNMQTEGVEKVNVDSSKLTTAQKRAFLSVKRIAVWPNTSMMDSNFYLTLGEGYSASLAEALSKIKGISVVTPARVSALLKKDATPSDLNKLTSDEAQNAFAMVSDKTNSNAIIYVKSIGSKLHYSYLGVLGNNTKTSNFIASVFINGDKETVDIPITLETDSMRKQPDPEKVSNLVNGILSKDIGHLVEGIKISKK